MPRLCLYCEKHFWIKWKCKEKFISIISAKLQKPLFISLQKRNFEMNISIEKIKNLRSPSKNSFLNIVWLRKMIMSWYVLLIKLRNFRLWKCRFHLFLTKKPKKEDANKCPKNDVISNETCFLEKYLLCNIHNKVNIETNFYISTYVKLIWKTPQKCNFLSIGLPRKILII